MLCGPGQVKPFVHIEHRFTWVGKKKATVFSQQFLVG